jgi:hypothetical protein
MRQAFTIRATATTAFIRLYHGGISGSGVVRYDKMTLFKGTRRPTGGRQRSCQLTRCCSTTSRCLTSAARNHFSGTCPARQPCW